MTAPDPRRGSVWPPVQGEGLVHKGKAMLGSLGRWRSSEHPIGPGPLRPEALAPPYEAHSFYFGGGTMRGDTPSYVARESDEALFRALKEGTYCHVLNTRQMGKSSLLVRTVAKLRAEQIDVATVDLTELGRTLSVEQWCFGLLLELGQQLTIEPDVEKFWEQHPQLGPIQRLTQALEQVFLKRLWRPLVICLDEIDALQSSPAWAAEFLGAVRSLHNRRPDSPSLQRLTFCFCGGETALLLVDDPQLAPFDIARRIVVEDFTLEEATCLGKGLSGDERAARMLLERVMYWTGGHPYLTQRLCLALAEETARITRIRLEPRMVDQVCEALFFHREAVTEDPNLAYVAGWLRSGPEPPQALERLLEVKERSSSARAEDGTGIRLRMSGVVKLVEGRLVIRNRIYERVFDAHWLYAHLPEQRAGHFWRRFRLKRLAWASPLAILLVVSFFWSLELPALSGFKAAEATDSGLTVALLQYLIASCDRDDVLSNAFYEPFHVKTSLRPRATPPPFWSLEHLFPPRLASAAAAGGVSLPHGTAQRSWIGHLGFRAGQPEVTSADGLRYGWMSDKPVNEPPDCAIVATSFSDAGTAVACADGSARVEREGRWHSLRPRAQDLPLPTALSLSGDGRRLAILYGRRNIVVANVSDLEGDFRLARLKKLTSLLLSAEGRSLVAFYEDGTVMRYVNGSTLSDWTAVALPSLWGPLLSASFSPDEGSGCLAVLTPGHLTCIDGKTSAPRWERTDDAIQRVSAVTWASSGEMWVVAGDQQAYWLDAAHGGTAGTLKLDSDDITQVAMSPDGDELAWIDSRNHVFRRRTTKNASKSIRFIGTYSNSRIVALTTCPLNGSQRLLVSTGDSLVYLGLEEPYSLEHLEAEGEWGAVDCSPDGRLVAALRRGAEPGSATLALRSARQTTWQSAWTGSVPSADLSQLTPRFVANGEAVIVMGAGEIPVISVREPQKGPATLVMTVPAEQSAPVALVTRSDGSDTLAALIKDGTGRLNLHLYALKGNAASDRPAATSAGPLRVGIHIVPLGDEPLAALTSDERGELYALFTASGRLASVETDSLTFLLDDPRIRSGFLRVTSQGDIFFFVPAERVEREEREE